MEEDDDDDDDDDVHFFSLHVSSDYVPIISRNSCISFQPAYQTATHTEKQVTKCHINTVVSPDDGHIIVRNM